MEMPLYKDSADRLIENLREWPIYTPRMSSGLRERLYEPVNELAKKIVFYRERHGEHSWCPKSPWLEKHARFFLPALLRDDASDLRIVVPRGDEWKWSLSNAPQYRVSKYLRFAYSDTFEPGVPVQHMRWPLPEWELKADNEAAEQVIEYYARNRAHRDLLPAPFDVLSNELFLPTLAKVREAA